MLIGLLRNEDVRKLFSGFDVYYFDSSFFANIVLISFLKKRNIFVKKLHFQMLDLKDEKGELVRLENHCQQMK